VGKDRLAAFSDGVIAILITIMVLELRIPHGADMAALRGVAPSFMTYVMSFVYLAIYWNNHHHLLHMWDGSMGSSLGQFSSVVLALADLGGDRLDGRKPPGSAAHRSLWCRTTDACTRLSAPAEGNHTQTRYSVRAGSGAGQ
jgi:Endosomal/lysosomal potassium channel TMEM175